MRISLRAIRRYGVANLITEVTGQIISNLLMPPAAFGIEVAEAIEQERTA
jgi:hypothetical protein